MKNKTKLTNEHYRVLRFSEELVKIGIHAKTTKLEETSKEYGKTSRKMQFILHFTLLGSCNFIWIMYLAKWKGSKVKTQTFLKKSKVMYTNLP